MIEFHQRGDVLEIVVNALRMNTLGVAERKGVLSGLEGAQRDAMIKAIVLRVGCDDSSAGADTAELGDRHAQRWLAMVINACEANTKPVVAAIHGAALGCELELAMACHYRVTTPGAKLGLPQVKSGLIPIHGGTRRLPRLIDGDVLGLHFFSPANVMKLVEVVRGAKTAPDVLATGLKIVRQIDKVPVVSGVCHGFIGNRVLLQRHENSLSLLLDGATPERIDRVHTELGMPMGPFQMADLVGLDLGWHRDPARVECLQDALCSAGRLGQKVGAGYYDYDADRRPRSSPQAATIIDNFRRQVGQDQRSISNYEIVARTVYTMVNEATKIVEEGIAQRASDIDVVFVHGFGWPRHKGGPMFWAQRTGLKQIVEGLERYKSRLGPSFKLSRLLLERSVSGQLFDA
jgi:3-hydroxyacyl-CoA dehydrogenase